jgi:hypothetical protein
VNVDKVNVAAGMEQAEQLGYDGPSDQIAVE